MAPKKRVEPHPFTVQLLDHTTVPDLGSKVVRGTSVSILAPWVYGALYLSHLDRVPPEMTLVLAFVATLSEKQLVAIRQYRPRTYVFEANFKFTRVPPLSKFTTDLASDIYDELGDAALP
jgi:hypothetical protein